MHYLVVCCYVYLVHLIYLVWHGKDSNGCREQDGSSSVSSQQKSLIFQIVSTLWEGNRFWDKTPL